MAGLAAALVAQSSMVRHLALDGATPNLTLATVVLAAVYTRRVGVHPFALAAGVAEDVLSGAVPGSSGLAYFSLAAVIRREMTRLDFDSYLLDLTLAAGVFLQAGLVVAVMSLTRGVEAEWGALLHRTLLRALLTILLAEVVRFLWKVLRGQPEFRLPPSAVQEGRP
jgi:rod shape-determining protein MreD